MSTREHRVEEADPFDLPEWVSAGVTWCAQSALREQSHVVGLLEVEGRQGLRCDLLAVDQAYPAPVLPDTWRTRAHRAWHNGQVLLLCRDDVLTLAVPGMVLSPDALVEAVARLAKAVGSRPRDFLVALRP